MFRPEHAPSRICGTARSCGPGARRLKGAVGVCRDLKRAVGARRGLKGAVGVRRGLRELRDLKGAVGACRGLSLVRDSNQSEHFAAEVARFPNQMEECRVAVDPTLKSK